MRSIIIKKASRKSRQTTKSSNTNSVHFSLKNLQARVEQLSDKAENKQNNLYFTRKNWDNNKAPEHLDKKEQKKQS